MKQPLKTVNFFRRALLRGSWEGFGPTPQLTLCAVPGQAAAYAAPLFDTGDPDTEYNRLTAAGDWQGVRYEVIAAASDTGIAEYRGKEIPLGSFLADAAVPAADKAQVLCTLPHRRAAQTDDLLLHGLTGRYLAVLLRFAAEPGAAPVLEGVRVEFPRCSFTEYFPEIYQQDDFFDRYVAVSQSRYLDLERRVDEIPALLDYETADEAHLRILAGWLGLGSWCDSLSAAQLRTVIRRLDLFEGKKGTRPALAALMELTVGLRPRILEHFQWANDALAPALRSRMEALYGSTAEDYVVLLDLTRADAGEPDAAALTALLAAYSPLGTRPHLVLLRRASELDTHCYLDVNSALSTPRRAAAGAALLGGDDLLG